jgi:hypothetical protein
MNLKASVMLVVVGASLLGCAAAPDAAGEASAATTGGGASAAETAASLSGKYAVVVSCSDFDGPRHFLAKMVYFDKLVLEVRATATDIDVRAEARSLDSPTGIPNGTLMSSDLADYSSSTFKVGSTGYFCQSELRSAAMCGSAAYDRFTGVYVDGAYVWTTLRRADPSSPEVVTDTLTIGPVAMVGGVKQLPIRETRPGRTSTCVFREK